VLSQRRLCNQQTLADLFAVSRGTIRNAIDDVLPLLEQDGYVATQADRYYRTAAHLLASGAATEPESPR
jgi:transcriptional antiterminator